MANPPDATPYAAPAARPSRLSMRELAKLAAGGEKLAMLTAYDASFAALAERAGVDILLVGDSLGMVVQGHPTTLPVTLDAMAYHVACVARGSSRPLIVADLPFGSYQESEQAAYRASVVALQAGAQMVKIEGGAWIAPTVAFLVARGVPVCGHVGLTPQSVNVIGGYRVQGRTTEGAQALLDDARALAQAGCSMIVVECVPRDVGTALSRAVPVPLIGIGAGPDCAGQVLVVYDALGIHTAKPARFVRNFMTGCDGVESALRAYVAAVKDGTFPAAEHCF